MNDWKEEVYRKAIEMDLPDNWEELRDTTIRFYKSYCVRCDEKFPKNKLTAHHMMPRDEGGSDDLTNLISLCKKCHDLVEINKLKTKAAIQGSFKTTNLKEKKLKHSGKEEGFLRPNWHAHVYGGDKSPSL